MANKITTDSSAIQVRVLVDITINNINVSAGKAAIVPSDLVSGLIESGAIDDNVEAVAYAVSQGDVIDTTITAQE